MRPSRSLLCLLMSALVLVAQLHVRELPGCSMCGSSCRCAARASGDSCSVRAGGCGGGGGDAIGSPSPLRAVLAAAFELAPRLALDRASTEAARLSPHPARPPRNRPPRASC